MHTALPTYPRPHADGDARPHRLALLHVHAPPRGAQDFGGSNRLILFLAFSSYVRPSLLYVFGRVERPLAPVAPVLFLRKLFKIFEFSNFQRNSANDPFFLRSFEVCLKSEQRWSVERKSTRCLFLCNTPQRHLLQHRQRTVTHAAFVFLHVFALSRTTAAAFASAPLLLHLHPQKSTACTTRDKKHLL